MNLPRPEHPDPQFERDEWINLNGTWTFEFDLEGTGRERGLSQSKGFARDILVPFCPESELSGVAYKDFIPAMWYQRRIAIPEGWSERRILLHFEGVDYESELYIDGRSAGVHFGGSCSFVHDITELVRAGGEQDLVLRVRDDTRSGVQPCGKQSQELLSAGCRYTRVTGIWGTVWAEPVDPHALRDVHIVPDLDRGRFILTASYYAQQRGMIFRATLYDGEEALNTVGAPATSGTGVVIPVEDPVPWSPSNPHLYDLRFEVIAASGRVLDTVKSYAGLRKVHVEANRIFLNNDPIYLRLVLDQGYYGDGIWTAPSDQALKRDIELSMGAGFNGARLHQKAFERRYHYWADRLGYLTWGESASWGCDYNTAEGARNFLSEWREIVMRDRNHSSIIAWTPWNETGKVTDEKLHARLMGDSYDVCKQLDPTRPVNDSSGYVHIKTDLWTVHLYEQDPKQFMKKLAPTENEGVFRNRPELEAEYAGQAYLVDEFGGIKWNPQDKADDRGGPGGTGRPPGQSRSTMSVWRVWLRRS